MDYAKEQPSIASPLGLLINYMENPHNDIKEHWETFSYFVEISKANLQSQNMCVTSILILKNDVEDEALKVWRWSSAEGDAAVNAMLKYKSESDWPQAYKALASYTYNGKTLPLKVGASVALKFIKKLI